MRVEFTKNLEWLVYQKQYCTIIDNDSKTIISGGDDDAKISIWDIDTGETLNYWHIHEPLSRVPDENRIYSLSVNEKNNLLVNSGGTKVWNLKTGKIIKNLRKWSNNSIVTSDGENIVSINGDEITIWSTSTWKKIHRCYVDSMFMRPIVSPNSKEMLLRDGFRKNIHVRDIREWQYQRSINAIIPLRYQHGGISYDSQLLALSRPREIHIFNYQTGELDLSISSDTVFISFSPDSRMIMTAGEGYLRFWNVNTGEQVGYLENHYGIYAISRDWSKLVIIANNIAQVWNVDFAV
jgi:WD40 repeat protein